MRFHSLNKHKEDCYVDPVKLKHIAELGLEDANLLHHNSISSRQFDKFWEKLSRGWRFIQFINAIPYVRSPSLDSSHPRRSDRGTRIKMGITGIGHDIPRLGSCVPSVSSEVLPCFKVIISVYLNSLCGCQKVNRCIKSKRKIGSGKWCQKWLSIRNSCSLIISFAKQTLCPHQILSCGSLGLITPLGISFVTANRYHQGL